MVAFFQYYLESYPLKFFKKYGEYERFFLTLEKFFPYFGTQWGIVVKNSKRKMEIV
jgi:hypothetical protein